MGSLGDALGDRRGMGAEGDLHGGQGEPRYLILRSLSGQKDRLVGGPVIVAVGGACAWGRQGALLEFLARTLWGDQWRPHVGITPRVCQRLVWGRAGEGFGCTLGSGRGESFFGLGGKRKRLRVGSPKGSSGMIPGDWH